jgi:DNA polymerase-3 subunit alpha
MTMLDKPFVHLHVHSQYSLLDGACRLNDLIRVAGEDGMEALALTDHGNLFGAVKFFNGAGKQGLRPIIGCEAYVCPHSRFDQDPVGVDNRRPYSHLILLCENEKGYHNLCELSTRAFLEGFQYKPRMDKELLRQYHEGIIALSACLGGEIPRYLRLGKPELALRSALEYRDIFGEGNFFLELQDHGIEEQKKVNEGLIEIHKETSIPLVATNDVHFLERDDFKAHNILLCIQTKTTRDERARSGKMAYTPDHYFKRRAEMWDLFGDHPDALLNTAEIAKRCLFSFDTHSRHYPQFRVPEGEGGLNEYFERVVRDGYQRRIEQGLLKNRQARKKEEYDQRLERELGLIKQMDLAGYFLVVWDFIRYAREQGIPVGPGRGSAAGSFVSYCMGITNLDPLRYGLLFERFLNPDRISMPDIDIDFCMRGRQEVISYVTQVYGRQNVAQIITFGEMKARLAIRDVGRALGVPLSKVDKVAKMVPNDPGSAVTIEGALKLSPQLKKMYDEDSQVKEVLDIAKSLEGLTRHASTHAAGVVIAPKPITTFLPLYKQAGPKGEITTQYSKEEIEALGLLKMDFLGLRTLTIIHDALDLISTSGETPPDIEAVPLDDKLTLELFQRGETDGVFQFESSGMKDVLRRLKPKRFEDLIVLNALYRPGPLDANMIPLYIARAHGKEAADIPIKEVAPILEETLGVIVYQEQVMMIAHKLADFTMGQADTLRKAISKKDAAGMERQKAAFVEGCKKHGVSKEKAEELFKNIETFGRYGFNKSHSAAYALVAFQTAYLKAHHPAAFMAATLSAWAENTDEILKYMNSCREMGIALLPPDVNRSGVSFVLEGKAIRYGLSAIKNVGQSSVEAILEARKRVGKFNDLFHFCAEVDRSQLNRRVLENLVQAGALDCFGAPRWDLFASLDSAVAYGSRIQEDRHKGQAALFGAEEDNGPASYEKGERWNEPDLYRREKESLGFYLTGHPLMEKEHILRRYTTHSIKEVANLAESSDVAVGGVVANIKQTKAKGKSNMYAVVRLEDMEGHVDALLFNEVYNKFIAKVAKDDVVVVVGHASVEEDRIRLIASSVVPLGDAEKELEQKTTGVLLKVPATLCDEEWLSEMEKILHRHKGSVPVLMDVVREGESVTRVALPQSCRVNTGKSLLPALESFLGKDRVRFLFRAANNGSSAETRR